MQTQLSESYLKTAAGRRAEKILRACVHCGFCNATCPTYQLSGNELDGPRGRIYQIKQMLEGESVGFSTAKYLDRCLNCLNCETTCPSGVQYHHLLEYGRELVKQQVKAPFRQRFIRFFLLKVVAYRSRFERSIQVARYLRPLMPKAWQKMLPHLPQLQLQPMEPDSQQGLGRRMLLLQGCVHNSLGPGIHEKSQAVLGKLGIQLQSIQRAECCGALSHHLQAEEQTHTTIKRNIDAWWPEIEAGAEAIISDASACSLMLKDYGRLMADDPDYADKARRVSEISRDLSEILRNEDLSPLKIKLGIQKVAYHPPCTLQHGHKLPEIVESILSSKGLELLPIKDKHLCCGSAGSYSLMQVETSQQLRDEKLTHLQAQQPQLIATANIGCLHHLRANAEVPVIHWLELFE